MRLWLLLQLFATLQALYTASSVTTGVSPTSGLDTTATRTEGLATIKIATGNPTTSSTEEGFDSMYTVFIVAAVFLFVGIIAVCTGCLVRQRRKKKLAEEVASSPPRQESQKIPIRCPREKIGKYFEPSASTASSKGPKNDGSTKSHAPRAFYKNFYLKTNWRDVTRASPYSMTRDDKKPSDSSYENKIEVVPDGRWNGSPYEIHSLEPFVKMTKKDKEKKKSQKKGSKKK